MVEICQNHPIQIRDQNQLYVGADPALGLKPPYTLAVELRRIFFLTEREERREDGGKRRGARRGSWRKNGDVTHLKSITEALQGDLYTCTWTCLCDAVTACSSLNSQEYILHLIHAPRQTGLGLESILFRLDLQVLNRL